MLMMRVQLPLVMMIIILMLMVVIEVTILRVRLPLVRLQEAWPPIDPSIVGVDWTETIAIIIVVVMQMIVI